MRTHPWRPDVTSTELESELEERFSLLRRHSYRVISEWDCQFIVDRSTRLQLQRECFGLEFGTEPVNVDQDLIPAVRAGQFQGFVQCTITAPQALRDTMAVTCLLAHSTVDGDTQSAAQPEASGVQRTGLIEVWHLPNALLETRYLNFLLGVLHQAPKHSHARRHWIHCFQRNSDHGMRVSTRVQ